MFRYIALAWQRAVPGSSEAAEELIATLQTRRAWQQDLRHPRIAVFSTGSAPGNHAYPLHQERGVVLGRLFLREQPLASRERIADRLTASAEVAATGGKALLENYWGRYVAFFEATNGDVQVLRDPSASLPCFALCHRGVTIVFSWLEDVLHQLPQIPAPAVSRQGLATFLAMGHLSGRGSALQGVRQVLAGERVCIDHVGDPAGDALWDASSFARQSVARDSDNHAAALREVVGSCVQAWSYCYDSILMRLSGGVDSSIVASCLALGRTPARVTCLNYHSPGADSDEREFARLAAASARLELIECERDASFRLERIFDVARTPIPNHYVGRLTSRSNVATADLVGATAMFTGAGGDQLFFEIPQWWPAADYLRDRGLDRGLVGAALDAARLGRVSVWSALRFALADRFRSKPPPVDLHPARTLVSKEVFDTAARPAGFVHPVLLSPSALPIGKLAQVQQLAYAPSYYDPFARERAPESVNPLLSQPIMELCLRLPTYILTKGGRGRALARDAFRSEIPDAIFRRRSKGGMGQHFDVLLAANLDFARQILLDGELVRLGLLDRTAVEMALSGRDAGQKTSSGEVHLAIGAEAWLQRVLAIRQPT